MKIYHFNYSSNQGGAARAANRIHQALLEIGLDSKLFVNKLDMESTNVFGPSGALEKGAVLIRPKVADSLMKVLRAGNSPKHSPALIPSRWLKFINNSDADIIHLHWINNEMLSISDIGKIKKPVVWTLHDMWPFVVQNTCLKIIAGKQAIEI